MATVPVTRTWTTGEIVTAAYLNDNVTAVLNFLLNQPTVQVRQTVSQSPATGITAFTSLTFTTEDVDNVGMHVTGANNDRLTAVYAGWYDVGGAYSAVANATGQRTTRFWGGAGLTSIAGSQMFQNASAAGITITPFRSMEIYLGVGQYIVGEVAQNGAATLATSVVGIDQSTLRASWRCT